jgi:hypothetical protein
MVMIFAVDCAQEHYNILYQYRTFLNSEHMVLFPHRPYSSGLSLFSIFFLFSLNEIVAKTEPFPGVPEIREQ